MLGQGCPTPEEKPLLELLLSGKNIVKKLDSLSQNSLSRNSLSQIGDRVKRGVNSLANKYRLITLPTLSLCELISS